jgi:hypothetical protein
MAIPTNNVAAAISGGYSAMPTHNPSHGAQVYRQDIEKQQFTQSAMMNESMSGVGESIDEMKESLEKVLEKK